MGRQVIWERLICLAGVAMCVVSYFALDKLGFIETRGVLRNTHEVMHVATVYQIGLRFGLASAVLGGIGWALSVRERRRLPSS